MVHFFFPLSGCKTTYLPSPNTYFYLTLTHLHTTSPFLFVKRRRPSCLPLPTTIACIFILPTSHTTLFRSPSFGPLSSAFISFPSHPANCLHASSLPPLVHSYLCCHYSLAQGMDPHYRGWGHIPPLKFKKFFGKYIVIYKFCSHYFIMFDNILR